MRERAQRVAAGILCAVATTSCIIDKRIQPVLTLDFRDTPFDRSGYPEGSSATFSFTVQTPSGVSWSEDEEDRIRAAVALYSVAGAHQVQPSIEFQTIEGKRISRRVVIRSTLHGRGTWLLRVLGSDIECVRRDHFRMDPDPYAGSENAIEHWEGLLGRCNVFLVTTGDCAHPALASVSHDALGRASDVRVRFSQPLATKPEVKATVHSNRTGVDSCGWRGTPVDVTTELESEDTLRISIPPKAADCVESLAITLPKSDGIKSSFNSNLTCDTADVSFGVEVRPQSDASTTRYILSPQVEALVQAKVN